MQNKDIYDTIIENLTKEWYSSMSENILNNNPNWEVPKYSKKQIDKAGKTIAAMFTQTDTKISIEDFNEAIDILNNWRSSHAYPLEVITNNLRRNNSNAIVVQRLKRLDSIIGKIERFPNMSLYRMQDLGGCRVIVDSIEDVYRSVKKFKNSKVRHIFKRENDYIQNPKESGYRSYHMVYQFQSDDNDTYNKNIFIEIQFRTKLQHIWATAVEMMGIFTKSKLKSSIGDEDILRFFVLVSSLFAQREETPICPNTSDNTKDIINEVKEINNKLHLVSRISALSVAIKHTNVSQKMKGKGYYVLILNYEKKLLRVKRFSTKQIDLATKAYNEIESKNDKNIDVVLVSAQSFDDLKEAYPNYFADISEFVNIMNKLLN